MRLVGADVFDGEKWHVRTDIAVTGHRISSVGTLPSSDDQETVDLTGHVVLPGLVDAHLHLFPGFLRRLPAFGVTAVVDLFATPRLLRLLREEEATPGAARFVSAGTGAAPTGGHPHQLAEQGLYDPFPPLDHPGQVGSFVDARVAEGAPFVKVFLEDGTAAGRRLPVLDHATLRALVDAAHARGLTVVAHAASAATAHKALDAGVDGLAHLPIPEPGSGSIGELVDRVSRSGTFVVTTLVSLASLLGQDAGANPLTPRTTDRVGGRWRAHLRLRAGPRDDAVWDRVLRLCAAMIDAGVPLQAGTDAAFPGVVPGASLHAELHLLRSCGMSVTRALSAATSGPSGSLWRDAGGRLSVGARADLVILGSDPRENIHATQDVVGTMVDGRLLSLAKGGLGARG